MFLRIFKRKYSRLWLKMNIVSQKIWQPSMLIPYASSTRRCTSAVLGPNFPSCRVSTDMSGRYFMLNVFWYSKEHWDFHLIPFSNLGGLCLTISPLMRERLGKSGENSFTYLTMRQHSQRYVLWSSLNLAISLSINQLINFQRPNFQL